MADNRYEVERAFDGLYHWSVGVFSLFAVVAMVTALFSIETQRTVLSAFLGGTVLVLTLEAAVLYRTVVRVEHESGPQQLTLASCLTLFRGVVLAVFGGVVVGALVADTGHTQTWIPALLYALAAGLDAVDGVVARATNSVTELGGRLDNGFDGLTVLVGTVAVVTTGAAPVVFLAAGIALYLFLAGIWWRRRRHQPVYELPPSQLRRVLGAAVMAVVFLGLVPAIDQAYTRPLAIAVLIPFLYNFTRDWLTVSGRLSADSE